MNLLRAASTISLLTLTSRITGLVREQLVAGLFGATGFTDAFLVAFRIPNLLRRLFAEGAFSQAFVPLLAASRTTHGDEATHALVDAVATVLLWALIATSVLGIVAAPLLVWLLGGGLGPKAFDASVVMTRFMFPYIGCMSLVALSAGILNTWRRFVVPAASPVLLNLSMIACGWALVGPLERAGHPGIYGMAAGVMLGGVLQLAVQWPALARIGMRPRMRWSWRGLRESQAHPGVRRMLVNMGPALLGVGVSQLSLMINTQISSRLGEGATSWLNYADRLMEFPIGLLGVALSAVLTPQLSAAQAGGHNERYSHLLDWGLRMVLLLALPCAVALLAFAEPLTAVLYHRGKFGAADVAHTAQSVMGWGVGLLGLIAVKVLAPGFYARQDTGTPARIAVAVLVLTQLFNLVFVPWFGVAGLALSIGLGALVNASWLLWGLRKLGSYRPEPGWTAFGLRVGLGCAAMGLLQWQLATRLDWIELGAHEFHRALVMAASLAGSAAVYFVVLMLAGVKLKALSRPA
ncbi:murein biosynthesis integral membrane protein MurJ [Pelomonas aquatica]|jgi:putative peptidoglycan lipid II flippase|uniref:Probable lipid II flippase MurJ n=1 Tax=Pelomonas aquatica TaxID=431058 RepID=A0A9X4R869_9BURK|nr:murein biosynthesis integral membrane protein MurJ [Pelomonas aquatica]MCY4755998.1 murein biosynthesis integral membrane protein MurJ [Pelomonas aquatica]MDG0862903.1 murein biosynthesis integral membrane protein MurJ [Pelomonas aquatica]